MNADLIMFLSFAMIIDQLFLDVLVGFLIRVLNLQARFLCFFPFYTSFSIDESIRPSSSSHLRSITSFLHPYLHPYFSNLFFDIAVMF